MKIMKFPYWPRRVIQGIGSSKEIINELRGFEGKKCLFFTDDNLMKINLTKETIALLRKSGYTVSVYSCIEENPSDMSVKKAVEFMNQFAPDILIYYGGGSVIDLGKAANVVYSHGGTVYEYEDLNGGIDKIRDMLLPSVAIATTAGSGSEVSSVSVITDTIRGIKMAIMSPYIVPTISVLDPMVTISMPPSLTAYTGFDAMVHGIEAYVSCVNFEPCRAIALKGIGLIAHSLRQAVYHGDDLQARMNMLIGSACGSMAFNNNYLGAVHGCAHQLSVVAGLPHGLANAMMLIHVIKWNIPSNIEAYADIAKVLGVDDSNITSRDAAEKTITIIKQLSEDIGIPQRLSEVGVTKEMIEELVDKAFLDHNMFTNPRKSIECPDRISKDDIRKLFMEAL